MYVYLTNGEKIIPVRLGGIGEVSPVTYDKEGKFFYFRIFYEEGNMFSKHYARQQDAEMAQLSAVSMLNALELFYERSKNLPEDRNTPVYFQVVDPVQKKLIPGKLSMYDNTPVHTIEI